MLIIRLQRTGKRNQADFRVVLAEKTAPVNKKITEVLGSYNPKTKDLRVKNQERLQYWIGQHVEMSPTVNNLFVTKGIINTPKVKAFNTPKKPVEAAPAEAAAAAPTTQEAPAEQPAESPAAEAPVTEETPAA